MARLAGIETELVQNDRIGLAKQFADEYGVTLVLKGAGTVIATNDGRVALNPTGNDGMGTAGAGDVLAGMIASLLGQGVPPYEAAMAGVYLHGLAGDFAAQEKGRISLMASDIVAHIPDAFKHILGLENFCKH
jgi:NAD(P)H-hydrate epimerase